MNNSMPNTPFSTALSRSAKETQMRIEAIRSGPKKRPPVILIALVSAVCLLCGNLVSCQMVEAESPESSAVTDPASSASMSVGQEGPAGLSQTPEGWTTVELDAGLMKYIGQTSDWFYENYSPTEKEMAVLDNLPGAELPREAVEVYGARRKDYWHDTLLPVAYDEGEDVTVYFVVDPDSMPNVEPLVSPILWGGDLEQQRGIVLRCGDQAKYFHLYWEGNAHFVSNPALLVDDLDGDGQPEAALVLTDGWGTGVYTESLYIFDLDTMAYTIPDYSEIPLEISFSPNGNTTQLVSGERDWKVDLTQLAEPFKGIVEVGNQVRFQKKDGSMICCLDLDFSGMTLEYLASAHFPVVYEDGVYKLGAAVWMGDILS